MNIPPKVSMIVCTMFFHWGFKIFFILSIKDDIVVRRQEAKSGHSSLSQITQKQYCMFSTRPRSIKKQNQRKMSLRPYKPYHTFSMRVRSGQVSSSASPPPQLAARHSGVSKGWQDRACSTLGKLKSETRTFLESYFNKQSIKLRTLAFGRHSEQMRCWSSQQKRGAETSLKQIGHSRSFSFDSITSISSFKHSDCASKGLAPLVCPIIRALSSSMSLSSCLFFSLFSANFSSR